MTGSREGGAPGTGASIVAVVTGATGGIGSVLGELCAAAAIEGGLLGCILLCRRPEALPFEVPPGDGPVSVIEYDATAPEGGLDSLLRVLGGLRGAAGVTVAHTSFSMGPIDHVGCFHEDDVARNLEVNVLDLVRIANSLCGWSRGSGIPLRLVNIDSGAAYRPVDGWSLYCSAKAYANMFLRCCAEEGALEAVTYEPGVVDTGMQREIRGTSVDRCGEVWSFRRLHDDGLLRSPRDVARDIFGRFILSWEPCSFRARYGG